MVFAAPLLASSRFADMANLPQAVFIQCVAALLTCVALVRFAVRRDASIRVSPFHLPLLLFIAWSGLTVAWSVNAREHLATWGQWAAAAAAFFLLHHCLRGRARVAILLTALLWSGCAVALIGIAQYLFGLDLFPQIAPPAATFANKNCAVHLVAPAVGLGVALFLRCTRATMRWLHAGAAVLMVAYLSYTGTRAGWVALAVQTAVWLAVAVASRDRPRPVQAKGRVLPPAVGCALLLLLVHLTPRGLEWRSRRELARLRDDLGELAPASGERGLDAASPGADRRPGQPPHVEVDPGLLPPPMGAGLGASFAGRIKVWSNTVQLIADHGVIGAGVGNLKIHYPKYDGRCDGKPMFTREVQLAHAHNDFLEVWAETGAPGVALLLWLAVAVVLAVKRLLLDESEEPHLVAGVVAALAGLAANALFSFPLHRAIPPLVLACLAAALAALLAERRQQARLSLPVRAAPLGAGVAVLALIPFLGLQWRRLRFDAAYRDAVLAANANRWDAVLAHATRATAHLPGARKAFALLGRAHLESGDLDKAIECLQQHLAAYPNTATTLFFAGACQAKLGRHDKALACYRRVEELLPAYPWLHVAVAAVHARRGKPDEALEQLKIEVRLYPDAEAAWLNLAMTLLHLERYEEACTALRWVVQLRPDRALACRTLGQVLQRHCDRPEEGREWLEKAARLEREASAGQGPLSTDPH